MMDEDIPDLDVLVSRPDAQTIPPKTDNLCKILEQEKHGDLGAGLTLFACQGCDRKFKKKRSVFQHKHTDGSKGRLKKRNNYKTLLYGHYVCLMDECKHKKEPCTMVDCKLKNEVTQDQNEEMGKIFSSRSQFWKHVAEVHSTPENLIHNCEFCSSKFALKGMKAEHHILRHIRPYICDYCGMQFGVNSSMKKHKRLHTGEKPYPCKYCDFVTNSTSTVLEHVRRKHDTTGKGKVYPCDKCIKVYPTEFARNCHVKEVHEKKIQYHCQICDKGFTALRFIKMHVKTVHLKMKDYGCTEPLCNYRASSKGNLDKHTKKRHGMVIPIRDVKPLRPHKPSRPKRNYEINHEEEYSPIEKEYLDLSVDLDSSQLPEAFKFFENFELVDTNQIRFPNMVKSSTSMPNNENPYVIELTSAEDAEIVLQNTLVENSEDIKPDISNCAIEESEADVELKNTSTENGKDKPPEITNREFQHDKIDEDEIGLPEIVQILLDLQDMGNTSIETSDMTGLDPIPLEQGLPMPKEKLSIDISCPVFTCTKTFLDIDVLNSHLTNEHCLYPQDMRNSSMEASDMHVLEPTPVEEEITSLKEKQSIALSCPILTCTKTFLDIDVLNGHLEDEHGLA